MTPMGRVVADRIRADGPMPVCDYLALAAGDPDHGYYRGRDPIGARGDFVTAPEISQMFGELIGLWCADTWRAAGSPSPVQLVELGPGKGTLMVDALRAVAQTATDFHAAAEIQLVEISPALQTVQRTSLGDTGATWHSSIEGVPAGPMLLIANEFIDALPIRQVVKTDDGWAERMVTLGQGADELRFSLGDVIDDPRRLPPGARADAPVGAIAEDCPAGQQLIARVARRLARDGGAALIIDYGHAQNAPGDTLQAVRGHRYADALAAPGEADLTAHVDFAALAGAARRGGASVWGPVTQSAFLKALGMDARAVRLKRTATPAQAGNIAAAVDRLTGRAQMGALFKAMALTHAAMPSPAGFDGASEP